MDDGGLACFVLWRAQVCLVAKLAREKNEGPSKAVIVFLGHTPQ
jgi:hypothetical protein